MPARLPACPSLLAILLSACLAAPAYSQGPPPPAGQAPDAGRPPGEAAASDGPAAQADRAAMEAMHRAMMAAQPTGNPDRDFVAGMIPHHQGAIDMARVELRYGHDPMLRRLAQDIVVAQTREIAKMRDWQRRHGVRPAQP